MASSTAPFTPRSPRPRLLVQREPYVLLPRQRSGLANLWQMPVLLVSLGLFTLAAYVFIDPQPAPAFQTQAALARVDLDGERFDAAIGRLNDLLATRPEPAEEAEARILLAEALDLQLRRNRRLDTPAAHRRIIQDIQMAYTLGSLPTVQTSDRLARSFEALGQVEQAAENYQRAIELQEQAGKPQRALPMRRSAIDMLIGFERHVSAAEAIDRFLAIPGLTDDERAWALCEMARLHIDAGRTNESRNLLSAAAALAPDLTIQGQVSFHLGYASWKASQLAEARRYLLLAREQLGEDHPQDAEVCYLLGRIARDEENFGESIAWFDLAIGAQPNTRVGVRAAIARAVLLVLSGEDTTGPAEILRLADEISRTPALHPVEAELLEAIQRSGRVLASRQHFEEALKLLELEERLDSQGAPEVLARRSRYLEGLIQQTEAVVDSSEEHSPAGEPVHLRELRRRAAEVHLAYAEHLATTGDTGYAQLLWKAVEQFELIGSSSAAADAVEQFVALRPDADVVPEALLRLARLRLAAGEADKATAAVLRLRDEQAHSPEAVEGSILLAELYHGDKRFEEALFLLDEAAVALPRDRPDPTAAGIAFLRGDCHRQIALALIEADSEEGAEAQIAAAVTDPKARRGLETAEKLFTHALDLYDQSPPRVEVENERQRLAAFSRAHCAFDLGRYEDATALYQQAAARHRDDLSVLTASIQIASANAAMGRVDHSRQMAQEIRRLLERIPVDDFGEAVPVPRKYWQRWLKHVEASGLW